MSTKSQISQNIIATLGIEALPDEEKIALVERIADTIEKAVFLKLYDMLSEEHQDILTDALTRGNMLDVETLIATENIDMNQIIAEETERVTQELITAVAS